MLAICRRINVSEAAGHVLPQSRSFADPQSVYLCTMSMTHRGSLVFSPLNIFVPKARVSAGILVEPVIAIVHKTRKRIVTWN